MSCGDCSMYRGATVEVTHKGRRVGGVVTNENPKKGTVTVRLPGSGELITRNIKRHAVARVRG